jgi:hypothetical protein
MRLAADQKSWRRISDGRESVCVVRGINRCARLLPWALRTGYQLVGDALELARRRGARLNAVAVRLPTRDRRTSCALSRPGTSGTSRSRSSRRSSFRSSHRSSISLWATSGRIEEEAALGFRGDEGNECAGGRQVQSPRVSHGPRSDSDDVVVSLALCDVTTASGLVTQSQRAAAPATKPAVHAIHTTSDKNSAAGHPESSRPDRTLNRSADARSHTSGSATPAAAHSLGESHHEAQPVDALAAALWRSCRSGTADRSAEKRLSRRCIVAWSGWLHIRFHPGTWPPDFRRLADFL